MTSPKTIGSPRIPSFGQVGVLLLLGASCEQVCQGVPDRTDADADTDSDADVDTDVDIDTGYTVVVAGDPDVTILGDTENGESGQVVTTGDVDGDGALDIIVGQGCTSTTCVPVSIFSGDVDDWLERTRFLSTAETKVEASYYDPSLSPVLVESHDVNADGVDDLWLTVDGDDFYEENGSAFLFEGPITGTRDLWSAEAILLTEGRASNVSALSSGHAYSSDIGDVLVGDEAWGDGYGVAYLLRGPVSGTVSLESVGLIIEGSISAGEQCEEMECGEMAGQHVELGDLNGDGLDDLMVAAMNSFAGGCGYLVYVFDSPHPKSGILTTVDYDRAIHGVESELPIVEGIKDINGDGQADVIVTDEHLLADGEDPGWYANGYVVFGPLDETSIGLVPSDIRIQTWVDRPSIDFGDLDGDGAMDMALMDGVEEAVYVFSGPLSGFLDPFFAADWKIPIDGETVEFPDLLGDDQSDLLLGCPFGEDSGLMDSGSVFVYSAETILKGGADRW